MVPEHHRSVGGGPARAAVFGVSDGLVSNLALILGVAGAHPAATVVRLAGLAGLAAGALSMAGGEYVSMRAQADLLQREIDLERSEIRRHPEAEKRELAHLYEGRGLTPAAAAQLAGSMMADEEMALETHAREELGINPRSLGSAPGAAASSLVSFAIGALVPLVPWFVLGGLSAIVTSIAASALVTVLVAIGVAALTGQPRLRLVARQLGVSALAAGVTYVIGRLVGFAGIG